MCSVYSVTLLGCNRAHVRPHWRSQMYSNLVSDLWITTYISDLFSWSVLCSLTTASSGWRHSKNQDWLLPSFIFHTDKLIWLCCPAAIINSTSFKAFVMRMYGRTFGTSHLSETKSSEKMHRVPFVVLCVLCSRTYRAVERCLQNHHVTHTHRPTSSVWWGGFTASLSL